METSIIEIESRINTLRQSIPSGENLEEAKILICKAQNIIQKHIEKTHTPSAWLHTRTEKVTQPVYNLAGSSESESE